MNEKREGKIMKWLNKITTFLLFAVLIGALFLVFVSKVSNGEPSIFGYQLKMVLSGSMEPDIQTGSVIAVKLGGDMSRFNKDDVITFREENKSLTRQGPSPLHSSGHIAAGPSPGDRRCSCRRATGSGGKPAPRAVSAAGRRCSLSRCPTCRTP